MDVFQSKETEFYWIRTMKSELCLHRFAIWIRRQIKPITFLASSSITLSINVNGSTWPCSCLWAASFEIQLTWTSSGSGWRLGDAATWYPGMKAVAFSLWFVFLFPPLSLALFLPLFRVSQKPQLLRSTLRCLWRRSGGRDTDNIWSDIIHSINTSSLGLNSMET